MRMFLFWNCLCKGVARRRASCRFPFTLLPSPANLPKSKCQHACKQNFQLNELMVWSSLYNMCYFSPFHHWPRYYYQVHIAHFKFSLRLPCDILNAWIWTTKPLTPPTERGSKSCYITEEFYTATLSLCSKAVTAQCMHCVALKILEILASAIALAHLWLATVVQTGT